MSDADFVGEMEWKRSESDLSVQYVDVDEWAHVVVNGWDIPGFRARVNAEDECVYLSYGQMMLEIPYALAPRVVNFIANAITVAQGFGGLPMSTEGELTRVSPNQPRRMFMIEGQE